MTKRGRPRLTEAERFRRLLRADWLLDDVQTEVARLRSERRFRPHQHLREEALTIVAERHRMSVDALKKFMERWSLFAIVGKSNPFHKRISTRALREEEIRRASP
jgi:hypothetical protein